ncbi:virulence-associated protein [Limnospira fusiformis CCALA 023]|nr:virulence-associated protein [Arthrospira platensis str. Paraca]
MVSLPGDDRAAKNAGEIRNNLASWGTPIAPDDLLMAARAIVNNFILVTHNTREFEPVSELRREDGEV